tara:strand:- start:4489 stop:4863 length:375 start_codon:yes stop_codon:yes gene_type:complete
MADIEITNREEFYHLIQNMNPGIIVIKFSAEWCKPCQKIKPLVTNCFNKLPDNAMCLTVDIDESFDLYAFLKQKKMLNGVPSLLCYHKNYDKEYAFIPKHSYSGSNENKINMFFESCQQECKNC